MLSKDLDTRDNGWASGFWKRIPADTIYPKSGGRKTNQNRRQSRRSSNKHGTTHMGSKRQSRKRSPTEAELNARARRTTQYNQRGHIHIHRTHHNKRGRYVIEKLRRSRATGPDNIHTEMLNELGGVNREHLRRKRNEWWRQGRLPEELLKARAVLIHKKGDKEDIANYRPPSPYSTLSTKW